MQETVVSTGAASAETETGGPQINLVPKDGGVRESRCAGKPRRRRPATGSRYRLAISSSILVAPALRQA